MKHRQHAEEQSKAAQMAKTFGITLSNGKSSKNETVASGSSSDEPEDLNRHKSDINLLRMPTKVKNRIYSSSLGWMNRFVLEKTIKRQ